MKFRVEILEEVEREIRDLEQSRQNLLNEDYKTIEEKGIEFVKVRSVQAQIFEIKTEELRSLFKYQKGKIIVIGVVFVKKSNKTPKDIIKLAKKRFRDK